MKKLLCLVLLSTMIVGCSSKEYEEDKVGIKSDLITQMLENIDDNKKPEEKDNVADTITEEQKDESADAIKTDEKKSNQSTSGSTNEGSGVSQESPAPPTIPKEEKPTPPVETPPPADPTPAPPTNQQTMAQQVFAQINAYRQQNGKEPLTYSAEMRSRCDSHALAMATREALWHSGDGAECIANYDDPFNAWVNSPPHNKLLLSNNTEGAVGIYYYDGYYYSVFQTRW